MNALEPAIQARTQQLNRIAEVLEADVKTAYNYERETLELLTIPTNQLTQPFFIRLVNLCYVMGVGEFNNSLVLGLVNSGFEEKDIEPVIEMTLLFYQTPLLND